MNLRLKRTPGLYLVGFMASGKTTVGRHLAHRMGWNFFDTDAEIEAAEKMAIAEIFSTRGEQEFRRIEAAILRQHVGWIERGRPAVVALGGGAFAQEANRELMRGNGITIWLDCPFETVDRRVAKAAGDPVRPLARDPAQFRALYDSRLEQYGLADVRIPITTDDPEETAAAILAHPIFR
jgi:shikimate kinase